MKNAYSLSIYICSLGVFLYSSSAYSSFSYANLVNQIKPNLAPESKPASYFTKLAAVHFVKDNSLPKFGSGGHDIKNDPKSCPSGTTWYGGSCQKNCDTNTYPYTDEPDKKKGNVVYEVCQGNIRFGYNSCNDGWLLNGAKCDVNPCTGYNLTSCSSSIGSFAQCKSGDDMKCKYTSCNEGGKLSDGTCVTSTCDASVYPYSSNPGSEAGTVISCKTGSATKYGYSACNTGWDKSNGYCNIHVCDTNTYPYTSNPGSTAGTVITCQTGSTTKYGYSACNSGWTKSGGSCNENACTGYPSTSQTITGCKTTENCKKGSQPVYKCTACNSGYNLTGGKCEASCDLSQYPYPYSPDSKAGTVISCTSGTTTKYGYSACYSGWTKSGNSCNINTCAGFNSTTSSIANCATTTPCQKGSQPVYKCTACNSGYNLTGGKCESSCDLSQYPYTFSPDSELGTVISCTSGRTTKYAYSSCNEGWTLSSGYCNKNFCKEYPSTTSSIANCASTSSCKKGAGYVYRCDECESGYYLYYGEACVLPNRPVIYSGRTAIGVAVSSNLAVAMTYESKLTWDNAVARCKAKTTGGKSWRLPTKNELVAMKDTNKATYATLELNRGNGMSPQAHWSSTEYSSTDAWIVYPDDGYTSNHNKTDYNYVRCVFDL